VTTDDFVRAHEDAANRKLEQFRLWYSQAGTPRVTVRGEYNARERTLTLHMVQHCPATPGQKSKLPFHIPVRGALFQRDGSPLASRMEPQTDAVHEHVFELHRDEQSFVLHDVDSKPVTSLLRGFSAPVKIDSGLDAAELAVLMAHDNDPFNRWDAGQTLALKQLLAALHKLAAGKEPGFDDAYLTAFGQLLDSDIDDSAFHALSLGLPDHAIVAEEVEVIDPLAIHRVINALKRALADRYMDAMLSRYQTFIPEPAYAVDSSQAGRRALKNQLLSYIAAGDASTGARLCSEQFDRADNMTDRMAALGVAPWPGTAYQVQAHCLNVSMPIGATNR
jgi:aminopeptidase N